jgi:hypothetical protein
MDYKIKGKWSLINYAGMPTQRINFYCEGLNGYFVEMGNGAYFQEDDNAFLFYDYPDRWQNVDFTNNWQPISREFYDWILVNAVSSGGEIFDNVIHVMITSAEGITLATKNTIVKKNIRVRIDSNLLGTSGYPIETDDLESVIANATEEDVGKIYKYTGSSDGTYTNGCLYVIE